MDNTQKFQGKLQRSCEKASQATKYSLEEAID